MGILGRPVFCGPPVLAEHWGLPVLPVKNPLTKARLSRSGFLGLKQRCSGIIKIGGFSPQPCKRISWAVHCSFNSSSDGDGSMAGNFSVNDEEYVNSSVIEAVEVRSGSDGFLIKMRDGKTLRCVHNNQLGGHLADYAPHPAIVLKMEDGSDLLLPIIVMEVPSILLMAAIRNVQIARPTIYSVVKEMVEKMGYAVQLVRVTKRVNEAYFAQLYLAKVGNEKNCISFDLRPSDAINMAVRCKYKRVHFQEKQLVHHWECDTENSKIGQLIPMLSSLDMKALHPIAKIQLVILSNAPFLVPIQVNKHLAYNDGMKVIEPSKAAVQGPYSDGLLFTELDRPDGQPCYETEEFDMVRNMLIAAVEERYRDAAQWRDKLNKLRAKRKNWA